MPSGGPFAWSVSLTKVTWLQAPYESTSGANYAAPAFTTGALALCKASCHGWLTRFISPLWTPPFTRSAIFPDAGSDGCSLPTLPLDLSAMAYRCHRAIGGSWTERLHARPCRCGRSCRHVGDASALCQSGTPRHVIMSCSATPNPRLR